MFLIEAEFIKAFIYRNASSNTVEQSRVKLIQDGSYPIKKLTIFC